MPSTADVIFFESLVFAAPADKKFTESGAEAPVLPHREASALFSLQSANKFFWSNG